MADFKNSMSETLIIGFDISPECYPHELHEEADWAILKKVIFSDLNKFCIDRDIIPLNKFVMDLYLVNEESDLMYYPILDALNVLHEILNLVEGDSVWLYTNRLAGLFKGEAIISELKRLEAYLRLGQAYCQKFYIGIA